MKPTHLAFLASALAGSFAAAGCAKPDLTFTDLSIRSCSGRDIAYSYTLLNRDYTGNFLVHPGSVGERAVVQAWVHSASTLDPNDTGYRTAGGSSVGPGDYGPDGLWSPGESVTYSFSATAGRPQPIDPSATPFLVLKVDGRNIFDPQSTNDGAIAEWNEANNQRSVAIVSCN